MLAGLLLVKSPARAKARLAPALSPAQRVQVAHALLQDALHLCARVPEVQWWVVSDDAEVWAAAHERGVATIDDHGTDLNRAVAGALAHVEDLGATAALVLPSDAPLTTPADVRAIIETGATSEIVLVSSGSDGGTNGLFLEPPTLIPPAFGTGSLRAHLRRAEEGRHRVSVLDLPRLALDLDTPADLDRLRALGDGTTATEKALRALSGAS